MTDGILLREISTDPMLRLRHPHHRRAHERSLTSTSSSAISKPIAAAPPDLKVIITSATIEPGRFAQHFAVPGNPDVPIIEVSGRTYPVEVRYRPLTSRDAPDSEHDHADLDQIQGIDAAITELWAQARRHPRFPAHRTRHPRHRRGTQTAGCRRGRDRAAVRAPVDSRPAEGVLPSDGRRIVLATNVAETSLTVPGIRYVIDVGTARISRHSTRTKVNRLPVEPVSQASARQRAGRCGRVAPGVCIRLYSEEDFDSRDGFTDPEILRTNLCAAVILQMASLRLGDVAEFPSCRPPIRGRSVMAWARCSSWGDQRNVHRDSEGLRRSAAAIAWTATHRRGPHDGATARRPRLARMLVEARTLGCLDHVLVIAAALSVPDVRERPVDAREAADTAHRRFVADKSGSSAISCSGSTSTSNERNCRATSSAACANASSCTSCVSANGVTSMPNSPASCATWTGRCRGRGRSRRRARSVLSGLLGNIAARNGDTREYSGARG